MCCKTNSVPETNLLCFQNCNIILNLPSQSNNSFFYSFQEQLSFSNQLLSDARLPHLCVAKCPKIRHVPQSREGRKFRIISGMWLLPVVRKLYLMPEGLWGSRRLLFHQSAVCYIYRFYLCYRTGYRITIVKVLWVISLSPHWWVFRRSKSRQGRQIWNLILVKSLTQSPFVVRWDPINDTSRETVGLRK